MHTWISRVHFYLFYWLCIVNFLNLNFIFFGIIASQAAVLKNQFFGVLFCEELLVNVEYNDC